MSTKIPFSTDELKKLLNVYEQEDRDLRKKLKLTQTTLRKLKEALRYEAPEQSDLLLTVEEDAVDTVIIKKDSEPENQYSIPKVPVSKRGRKPKTQKKTKTIPSDFDISQLNWRNFIVTSVRNQNEIMSIEMLADLAVKAYNLKAFPLNEITMHVKNTLKLLVEQEVLFPAKLENDEKNYFGYSPWFDQKGGVKSEYLSTYKFSDEEEAEAQNKENDEDKENEKIIASKKYTNLSKWELFILETLNKTRKLHTEKEFMQAAMLGLSLTSDEKENLEVIIEENVENMLHSEDIRRMPVSTGGYQYSLPHWFKKGDGRLKVYYMSHP